MTLILELPEELERQLRHAADEKQVSPEDLALLALRESLKPQVKSEISDEEFAALADQVIADNLEVLKRLAK